MHRSIVLILLLAISFILYGQNTPLEAEEYVPSWNVSPNTRTLFLELVKASENNTPVFSAHFFYNYYSKNVLWKKRGKTITFLDIEETNLRKVIRYDVGQDVLLYGIDAAHCEERGWFSGETASKRRASVISLVRKAWIDNKSVPIVSWHLENPYVPHAYYSIGGESRAAIYDAAREFQLKSGEVFKYPSTHKNVPKEIMSGVQYDEGIEIYDEDGHWLPSENSTKCGKGRLEEGEDASGYDSPAQWFNDKISDLCSLINEFTDQNGDAIPIILRLYHEPETRFAWWGYGVPKNTYKEFMRFTIRKIREKCIGKNVLFAYCKDRYWGRMTYDDRYPGDDYIDVVGYDDYTICTSDDSDEKVIEKMRIITDFAKTHKKIPALFETGNKSEYSRNHRFLSDHLYKCLMADGVNLGIVQLWSTFTTGGDKKILEDYRDFLQNSNILTVMDSVR